MATRQQLLAQLLASQPNVTTGAASPALRMPATTAPVRPTAASVDKNQRLMEILSTPVETPRTRPGEIAPVDAQMVAALGNIGKNIWTASRQKKADEESRRLLADELALAQGKDPFASELQPVAPPSVRGIRPMAGPGEAEADKAQQVGRLPFEQAVKATAAAEAPARAQHDQAALSDPNASSLAASRVARATTPPSWSEPYVDESTGSLVQKNIATGQVEEISRAATLGGANSRFASPQITESGRIVMMDKSGGPAIYADTGDHWDGATDPVSADMQLITLPDGSVQAVNMRRDVGRAPARTENVVDSGTAVSGAAERAGAETAATEAAETAAIPERTRVEAQAEDFAEAPARLESARAVIRGVDDLDKVFEDVLANANLWTTGFMGRAGSYAAGSPQADLAANINTLAANAAFDRLQQMRDSSKTGGALGQVSEMELQLLRDAMAALSQSQSPEQFKTNVERLRERYQRSAELARQSERMDGIKSRILALQNRPQSPQTQSQIDGLFERLYREEDKLWTRLDEYDTSGGISGADTAAGTDGDPFAALTPEQRQAYGL